MLFAIPLTAIPQTGFWQSLREAKGEIRVSFALKRAGNWQNDRRAE
jgi:hypothetical protein